MSDGGETVDQLPEDLQPELVDRSEYIFPNNSQRRSPGYLYIGISAVVLCASIVASRSAFVNPGIVLGALAIGLFGCYHVWAARPLKIDEIEALTIAGSTFEHPVGHASAQMVWRGISSSPIWRILLYSGENPPKYRGFATIDGRSGEVLDSFSEENPEEWAESPT